MESVDEIAQDSPCPRVYKQGRHSRAGDVRIDVTDAVIGPRSVPQKIKQIWTKTPSLPALACVDCQTHPIAERRCILIATNAFQRAFASLFYRAYWVF